MAPSISEPGAVYEVKLVAYNGNGESDSSARLVSLVEERMSNPTTGECRHTLCPGNVGLSAVIKAEQTPRGIKNAGNFQPNDEYTISHTV